MNNKKILFLHPNFPGQFKTLALAIAELDNIDVKFLCMTNYGTSIRGIKALKIKGKLGQDQMENLNLNEISKMEYRANSYRIAFTSLKDSGWTPNIVIGHTGWGCGIHVKDIWKDCIFIGYSEWWFSIDSELSVSAKQDPHMAISDNQQIKSLRRNQYMALELCTADTIVTPSSWQRNQLPATLKEKCIIINDGIDIEYFSKPVVQPHASPVITYGTRGMEPMRHFKQFIECLPHLLRKIPAARIEIAGEDQICYGGLPPNDTQSWGEWAKEYLDNSNAGNKVMWKGRMSMNNYRNWLQQSWCHIYLSHPFVASWSLLESMVTGIPIVANRTLPIQEFADNVDGVTLIESLHPNEIVNGVLRAVVDKSVRKVILKRHSRRNTCEALSADRALAQWELVTGLQLHTRI